MLDPKVKLEIINHARNNPDESLASIGRRFNMSGARVGHYVRSEKKRLGDKFYLVNPSSATEHGKVLAAVKKMRNRKIELNEVMKQTGLNAESVRKCINYLQNKGAIIKTVTTDDNQTAYVYKGTKQIKEHTFQDAFRMMPI